MRTLKHLLLSTLLLLAATATTTAVAQTGGTTGDLQWEYSLADSTLTISGSGVMPHYYTAPAPWAHLRDSIKHVNIETGVTTIGNSAFNDYSAMTSVSIPNSVTTIGQAFRGCTGLTSVSIPNSVTTIAGQAFRYCSGLTSLNIPNSVTSLGSYTFQGCTGLTSVVIPNSVTRLEENVFGGCTGLTSAILPNSITFIGNYAFQDCSGLTSFAIPGSVTSIGYYAFNGCTGLTSLNIPNSVTSIRYYAFYKCSGLTSLSIPSSITLIEDGVFRGCSGLTSVSIPGSVTSIGEGAFSSCSGLTSVSIPNSVTSIGEYAFSGDTSLTSLNIPNSVTSIGEYAFSSCSGLTSFIIPNMLDSIERFVFSECSGLASVTIPNSVTSIRGDAFGGCTSLTEVINYAATPQIIKANVFGTIGGFSGNPVDLSACTLRVSAGLGSAYQAADVWKDFGSIEERAFVPVTGVTISKTDLLLDLGESQELIAVVAPDSATYQTITWSSNAPAVATVNAAGLVTAVSVGTATITATAGAGGLSANCAVTISGNPGGNIGGLRWEFLYADSTLTISGNGAIPDFSGSASAPSAPWYYLRNIIKYVDIKTGVTAIGNLSFRDYPSLITAIIGNSVTTINSMAFYGCASLASVAIPNSVIRIGSSAFTNCKSLASVTIPNSVVSIGNSAFYGTGLASVTIPSSLDTIGGSAFSNCDSLTAVSIPASVTIIGNSAFSDCDLLTAITVEAGNPNYSSENGVMFNKYKTTLLQYPGGKKGEYAIPASVTTIGNYAFAYCRSLTAVAIPGSIDTIGSSAFSYCRSLTAVSIPGSVTVIDRFAFNACTALTEVSIPSSVTVIGELAFQGCDALRKFVNHAQTPQIITANVFNNASPYACTLYVPAGSAALYQAADVWKDFDTIVAVVSVTGVTLDFSELLLEAGEFGGGGFGAGDTATLVATVTPDSATIRTVMWGSSAPAVATVDTAGLVRAVSAGEAFITVTTIDGGFVAVCTVSVAGLAINKTELSLKVGETETLIASIIPEGASGVSGKTIVWSSSSPAVATVDASLGVVTAVAEGEAFIIASTEDGGLTDTCKVTVGSAGNGIAELLLGAALRIYPNPVWNELNIDGGALSGGLSGDLSEDLKIEKIEILNLSGKTVLALNSGGAAAGAGGRINVSALPSGIYFIKVKTPAGIITRKFVKR